MQKYPGRLCLTRERVQTRRIVAKLTELRPNAADQHEEAMAKNQILEREAQRKAAW